MEAHFRKFHKMGVSQQDATNYFDSLFTGLNLQVYNTPIDLFIEDFLYKEFPALRPYQFISLYTILQEGLKAVTDKKIVEFSPAAILSKSKIYNVVHALQFATLYGIDYTYDFHANPSELKQARIFYDEYLQYKENKEPAEEYELVMHWAEDLHLEGNFELIDEKEYTTKRTDIDNLLDSIDKDPYDFESDSKLKEKEMDTFQKAQEKIGVNMAVVMFMEGALKYFEGMPKEKIKEIAIDIAVQGTQGYNPSKNDYRINAIPGKLFSGYHVLAYFYVSWMLAMPEMVGQLGLNYAKEYQMAIKMFN